MYLGGTIAPSAPRLSPLPTPITTRPSGPGQLTVIAVDPAETHVCLRSDEFWMQSRWSSRLEHSDNRYRLSIMRIDNVINSSDGLF